MNLNHKISIHVYKHDATIYRAYEFAKVISSTDNEVILNINGTKTITLDKGKNKFYHSIIKNKSLWVFPQNEWYNFIVTLLDDGTLTYYFNLSSPFIFEEEAIKYIDYDLDYRVNTKSNMVKLLDEVEYVENSKSMEYSDKLKKIIEQKSIALKELIESKYFEKNYGLDFIKGASVKWTKI